MNGKKLLLGLFASAMTFCASAQVLQIVAPGVVQQGNVTVIGQAPHSAPPSTEPPGDVVEFFDGSTLHGQLLRMDTDHGLAWENPNVKGAIHFQPSHIDFIRFARGDVVNLAPTCHIQFVNGDDLFGTVTSMDSERLGVSTWFGGAMTIPRSAIRSVTFLSKNYSILYEGPYDANGWIFGIANMPQSWAYHDGWFTSQGTGCLGRELGLTNSSTVEFDLSWTGILELETQLYTDGLERMENNNGSYVLQFTPGQINLRQARAMGALRSYGAAPFSDAGGKNRIHVAIQCNPTEGTLAVYVNDTLAKVWKIDTDVLPSGTGILFQQVGFSGGTVKLGNLRISRWDGSFDPETVSSPTNTDSVRFVNHDHAAGKIMAIKDGKVTLQFNDTELKIPLQRVTQLNFAATNAPSETASPWEVRAHFPGGGSLSFQLEKWDDKTISGRSSVFGLLAFEPRAVRQMEFNLDRPKDDVATAATKEFSDLDE
jgi:hypothetical protein